MKAAQIAAAMEASWPPLRQRRLGPFLLREGAGGGKRVSAASLESAELPDDAQMAEVEAAMAEPLFVLSPGQAAFDQLLAARGYALLDPSLIYTAPVEGLTRSLPPLAAFPHWPPLAIARDIWAEGGIGPARIAVMERVAGPRTVILARIGMRSAGAVFVAAAGEDAMLHALEVTPALRRQGAAGNLLAAAANWAAEQGALRLSLQVTKRNLAAQALYQRAGMAVTGEYHYRLKRQSGQAEEAC